MKLMVQYREEDEELADMVVKKFQGQHWYLTEENVLLAVLSEATPDETKEDIAKKLSSMDTNFFRMGRPTFPSKVEEKTGLVDLKV